MADDSPVCSNAKQGNSLDDDPRIRIGRLLRRAIEDTGTPHKIAAAAAGFNPVTQLGHWTRVLDGDRPIRLDYLGNLPVAVQREFLAEWAARLGMRVERRKTRLELLALSSALKSAALALESVE